MTSPYDRIRPQGPASRRLGVLAIAALVAGLTLPLLPAARAGGAGASLVLTAPDDAQRVRLPGHVHALAQARFDAGAAPPSMPMPALELVLGRSAAQAAALEQFLADQQDPRSREYHHWLSPQQYGARFGASDADIQAVVAWLQSHGFTVGSVPPGRGQLRFSGTEAQVEAAFHTPIHLFNVHGEAHFANVTDPQIPVAFQALIKGIRGLHDFHPTPGARVRRQASTTTAPGLLQLPAGDSGASRPDVRFSSGGNAVAPADFATIYNLTPLYEGGLNGSGVTIAIAAQSDIDQATANAYWSTFGVAAGQQLSSVSVPGGTDPGRTGDSNELEADLDVEIAGGLAPGAKILLVRDQDVGNAASYVIQHNLAAVLSISFGGCEYADGPSNSGISSLYQQAVAQGITVVVSTGDDGAADCSGSETPDRRFTQGVVADTGLAVNGLASTPYNLAVGGTNFDPTQPQNWSNSNSPGTHANALSYVPEMVWNDMCTNPAYWTAAYPNALALCNAPSLTLNGQSQPNPYIEIAGGSGGLSSCATVSASGACTGGYPQPSWQAGVVGVRAFGARALPDVSMLASAWVICTYQVNPTCAATGSFQGVEGTSAAAPAMAAVLALLDQSQSSAGSADGRQGLVNPLLYSLAAFEYGTAQNPNAATLAACNASKGQNIGSSCVFQDVTVGNNAVPCVAASYQGELGGGTPTGACIAGGNAFGVLELSGSPAYAATAGYDLATGLGSLNAGNLVAAVRALAPPTDLGATASGQAATLSWNADSAATSFDVYQGAAAGQEGTAPVQTQATGTTATVSGLQTGRTYYFTIAAISAFGVSAMSNEAQVTTAPAAPTGLGATPSAGAIALSWTASTGAASYSLYQGTAAGGEGATAVQTGLTATSATVSGLAPGKTYFFNVVAVDAGGPSPASAEASATVPPSAPTAPSATAGNGSVTLSWSAGAGAVSYNVYQGTAPGAEGAQPVQSGVTGTSVTVGGLSNGTTYYFDVVGVDAGGNSPPSAEVSAKPVAPAGGGGGSIDVAALALLALSGAARWRRGPASLSAAARRR